MKMLIAPAARPVYVIILAVFVLAVYANTFDSPFVFDDEASIVNNSVIRDLSNFLKNGSGYEFNPRRFIAYMSFALNYAAGGTDVRGYHLVNTAIHAANGILLYFLLLLTFETPVLKDSGLRRHRSGIAFFSALFFAVHPLQTQAVTYIVQRITSLAALFLFASLLSYGAWRMSHDGATGSMGRRPALYLLSLICMVLAMKTKEIAFVMPLIAAGYEFFFFTGSIRKRLFALAPLLLTMAIIPISLLPLSPVGTGPDMGQVTRVQTELPRADYLLTQSVVIVRYLGLLVLPLKQNIDHDQKIHHTLDGTVLLSLLLLAALAAVAVVLFRHSGKKDGNPGYRLISFGILWFFTALSVESSVIPIVDVMFEHRVYVPSAGFFFAAAATAYHVRERIAGKRRNGSGRILAAGLLVTALVLAGTAFSRNQVWRSPYTLWKDAAAKSPEKARPLYNVGLEYEKQGRLEEAVSHYERAIRKEPRFPPPYNNLGILYGRMMRYDEAEKALETVFRLEPGDGTAHTNLGIVYAKQKKRDKAVRQFQEALRLDPGNAEAHFNLGIAWEEMGRVEDAASAYRAAIGSRENHLAAYNNLGILYIRRGDAGTAISVFRKGLQVSPDDPALNRNLVNAVRLAEQAGRKHP